MRIGILTFHNAHNYGASLQCFALQQYLHSEGHTVDIIDYRPECYSNQYAPHKLVSCLGKNPLAAMRNVFYNYVLYNKRCFAFNRFISKHLHLSKKVSMKQIPDDYQMYIVGSDQIWNPAITNGFDGVYFCDFHFAKGGRKYIAFAPSMELESPSEENLKFLEEHLEYFDALSARENSMVSLLESITRKKVDLVCDPTFLLRKNQWMKYAKHRLISKPYVVLYQVRDHPEAAALAYMIAKKICGKVVCLTARIDKQFPVKYQTASPLDFINYFAYADYVVTTSFHGTAFSLIMNVPFYTMLLGDNFDSRSSSLLKEVCLEDRLVMPGDKVLISPVDFENCNIKLNELVKHSTNYLAEALTT